MSRAAIRVAKSLTLAVLAFAAVSRGAATPFTTVSHGGQDEPIRLRTDLVTLTASVTDRTGRAVKSLQRGDFEVYEDGVRQEIGHFAPVEEPFSLMLLVDVSGSTRSDLSLMKQASANFLAELRPDDRVGIVAFSTEIELISALNETASARSSLDQLEPPIESAGPVFTSASGTSFYDALHFAISEAAFKKVEGRKAIVCMSDGVDSTSKLGAQEVARLLERSGASTYFLELDTEQDTLTGLLKPRGEPGYINLSQSQINRYFDQYDPASIDRHRARQALPAALREKINAGLYRIARREVGELSERTGGRVYQVRSLSDLDGVYKQVADDLRSQYSIGYYPKNEAHDGRWRAIRVEVRRRGVRVRARSGYWATQK